jgi:hypothetical protein
MGDMLTMNSLGDGSTLSLDFTTMGGVLDPRLTFSRAGGGTYVGADGYIYGVDSATSASLAIGTGSKSVTLTATANVDRRFQVGQTVYFSSGANNMSGLVTAYNASTQVITINATATTGSGSFTSWFVGNASPRFDYSPTNIGEPRGLLIEGQAVNYMLQSNSLTGYSVADMATPTAGSEPNPEGIANSALQIYATAGATTYHGFYRTLAAGTNTQITVSIWAKARNYTHLFLSDLFSARAAVRFNLSTGVTDNNFGAGYVSAKATAFPNGWWRCEMVVNVTASTNYGWAFVGVPTSPAPTLGAAGAQYAGTGNAADGIYCYGFSVEGGSGASSYIPTGASTVTRNADACSLTGTNFTNVFGDGSVGTITCSHEFPRSDRGVAHQPTPFAIGSYTAANARGYSYGSYTLGVTSNYGWVYTSAAFTSALTSVALAAKNKCAISYNGLAVTAALNGTTNSTTGTGTITVSSAVGLQIGYNATPRDFINACVSNIKFYPTALTAAQLQAITAP